MYLNGCFSEKSTFFADSQLMHGPMMLTFKIVQAILSMDLVQTFELDALSGHKLLCTQTQKRQKQMRPKLIPSEK